jgi:photosystem II stability/assembly factor-like uncharacterized protein
MRKKISFFALFALCNIFGYSQSGWSWQNPKVTGNTLFDVEYIDTLTGWSVGSSGQILKTQNGGLNWECQLSPVEVALRSISFIDKDTGWISGDKGCIIKTINGGKAWNIQTSNTTNALRFIKFINSNIGYAFGESGTILTTTNGGDTWIAKSVTSEIFYSGYLFSKDIAFAIGGNGVIVKTTNGGETWIQKTSNTKRYLYAIDFISPDSGWIADAASQLHKTTDGGENWVDMNYITQYHNGINTLEFINDSVAYASGAEGIYKSTDTTKTWAKQSLIKSNYFYGTCALDTNFCVAVGTSGEIVRTTNGGKSWQELYPTGITGLEQLTSIQFLNTNLGYAAGCNGVILKTTDGGENWSALTPPTSLDIRELFFINKDIGWVCGDEQFLAKTTDGGASWSTISRTGTYPYPAIQFIDENTGWMLYTSAYDGKILKTNDGGINWTTQIKGDSIHFWNLYFLNNSVGFAGGVGQIYRTINGGNTWEKIFDGKNWVIRDIKFNEKKEGWFVGDNGYILHCDSTWSVWNTQTSTTTNNLYGINVHGNDCWAVGKNGTILHSTNGGNTWTKQVSNTFTHLYSVSFPSVDVGWTTGVNGCILKTISNTVQESLSISNHTLSDGETQCFNAYDTIIVAGSSVVTFARGSSAELIAGKSIRFLPGFYAEFGSFMYTHITSDSTFCNGSSGSLVVDQTAMKSTIEKLSPEKQTINPGEKSVKVYPNPNNGQFNLELINFEGPSKITLINTLGVIVFRRTVNNSDLSEFELTNLCKGLYFVNIKNGDTVKTCKMVVQ